MSDYLYSSSPQQQGFLTNAINAIYLNSPPLVREFHGDWGSLAVSQGHYLGFQPYDTDHHLLVVIGGPVLYFRDNDFLVNADSCEATQAIYHRWQIEDRMEWDEDLSGPFTILLINKIQKIVQVVADLMGFIPVYACEKTEGVYLGTHIDALAIGSGEGSNFDQVSLADFVLNDVVTYPYTAYENIRQLPPSSKITLSSQQKSLTESYWVPEEENRYRNIQEAAEALRKGFEGYIQRVTDNMSGVAQFISGGEDSRSLSGMLPGHLERDAYIFLDHMNREGRIAKQVAETYKTNFTAGFRNKTHYLEILPDACKLVGSGHQYIHAHSLGFDKKYKLAKYPAVFGGYLSDSLLKSAYARNLRKTGRYPFVPDIFRAGESQTNRIEHPAIQPAIIDEINIRRAVRFAEVREERPVTAHEWFVLRPATMRVAISNLYTNRRLFRSYEPFMCKEAVKISAAVPTSWKLNRRLFNRAMKPYLKPSRWILHADGRLPYFSWWSNIPLQFTIWFYRHAAKRIGLIKGNQGPWGDWLQTSKSPEWEKFVDEFTALTKEPAFLKEGQEIRQLLLSEALPVNKRVNLLQTSYLMSHVSK